MTQVSRLAALIFVVGAALPAVADGIRFGSDYDAGLQTAQKDNKLILVHFTQKASPACVTMAKQVFSNADAGQLAAKKFVALKVSGDDDKGNKIFQQFAVRTTPTVIILDPHGEELVQENFLEAPEFISFMELAISLNSALESLGKVKKDNSVGMSAALKKIGAIDSKRSVRVLREHAENENLPESVRRTALEGLGKQKEVAGELVPFLSQKSQVLRTSAYNSLKAMGADAVTALIKGLDGYSPELRVSCYTLAAAHTKNAKISKDAAFWRTGATETREAAIKVWKEWWEKNKPEPKS